MWRLYLASPLLGETNAEHAQHVAVCCLDLHMSLNQSLPLAYQTAQFVCGEVHALYRIIKLDSAYSPSLRPSCCCGSFQPLYCWLHVTDNHIHGLAVYAE
jgi:hypothetical protein